MRYEVDIGQRRVRVESGSDGRLLIDDRVVAYDARETAAGLWSVLVDGASHEVALIGDDRVRVDGVEAALVVADERALAARSGGGLASAGRHEVRAPMPGLLKAVHVSEGDVVEAGAPVATLEAMKMENELRAPARARVQRLAATAGAKIESGALVAVLVDEPAG